MPLDIARGAAPRSRPAGRWRPRRWRASGALLDSFGGSPGGHVLLRGMSRPRLRSPFDRGRTRLRAALMLVVGVAPALACRSSQATGPGPALTGTLDPGSVAPEFEAD